MSKLRHTFQLRDLRLYVISVLTTPSLHVAKHMCQAAFAATENPTLMELRCIVNPNMISSASVFLVVQERMRHRIDERVTQELAAAEDNRASFEFELRQARERVQVRSTDSLSCMLPMSKFLCWQHAVIQPALHALWMTHVLLVLRTTCSVTVINRM